MCYLESISKKATTFRRAWKRLTPRVRRLLQEIDMAFIVNSSPGAGLRFEPSNRLGDAKAALEWASDLSRRGMRLVRIRDTDTGRVFDERQLREEIKRLQEAA